MDIKQSARKAQGSKVQTVVQSPPSAKETVGTSSSVPGKLRQGTKEMSRPPRSSLPASMPSRNSKEKVAQQRVWQERVTPPPAAISLGEDATCGKHVAFKAQGDGVIVSLPEEPEGLPPGGHREMVGGSASVPNRLQQGSKEALPRPLRYSLPATLQSRDSEEMDVSSHSIGHGSTVTSDISG